MNRRLLIGTTLAVLLLVQLLVWPAMAEEDKKPDSECKKPECETKDCEGAQKTEKAKYCECYWKGNPEKDDDGFCPKTVM